MTERVIGGHSLFDVEKPELCPDGNHPHWRTIVCDGGDIDVVECSRCGKQTTMRCNFDEEYS